MSPAIEDLVSDHYYLDLWLVEGLKVVYSVTPELRVKLKEPFGLLLCGSPSVTMNSLATIIAQENPPAIVAVGDIVSKNLYERGLGAKLLITDGKCMRKRIKPSKFPTRRVIHAKNLRGTISGEAITAVRRILQDCENVHLVVDGEEDLLALVAVRYAPSNSLVVYGQPGQGIVVVRVTEQKRDEAEVILKEMETVRKAK